MDTKRIEAEAQVAAAVLQAHGGRCDRAYLRQRLPGIPLEQFNELVEAVAARGIITNPEGGVVEAPNAEGELEKADALAAVVLYVLVDEQRGEFVRIAEAVERDMSQPEDRAEVALALRLLELYELAVRTDEGWQATLAAHKAADLSF